MQIESLEIKNYRLFRDAKLVDLPRLTIVVGANGSGKSTLFDIFSFLKEALNHPPQYHPEAGQIALHRVRFLALLTNLLEVNP